jgi:nitrogen regulatory protein P-II 1
MSHLVVLIVVDVEQCPAVLDAWERIGVPGVTILASSGLGQIRQAGLREDFPLMPNLHDLLSEEFQHRTIFSVVETQEMIDEMISAAEEVLGCLDDPDTGFMFVIPASRVYGRKNKDKDSSSG